MSKWLIFAFTALISVASIAQDQFVAGKDYQVIETPVKTGSPDKVEVTEIFWYGCPHCNQFRPVFEQWKSQQSDDIFVRHSPAMWSKNMVVHARIFYTAAVLGKQKAMHKDIFDAMHLKKKRMLKEGEIYEVFKAHGVSKEKFDKTFKSFGVNSMVKQADARARSYGINGTPELIINGKYRTSASMAGSTARMLQVTEHLIKKEKANI